MASQSAVALVLFAVVWNASAGSPGENEMIFTGGCCESNGFWISGPSLYVHKGTPAVVAAMVKTPSKDRNYAYLFVIKGDEQRKATTQYDSNCGISGKKADSRGSVEIAAKKIAFEYRAELDPMESKPLRETLSINGKALDLGRGRVVLFDVSGDQLIMKQIRIALPSSSTFAAETAQVESQAKKLLELLRRGDKEARDFLK
jgi:hypothetical protein